MTDTAQASEREKQGSWVKTLQTTAQRVAWRQISEWGEHSAAPYDSEDLKQHLLRYAFDPQTQTKRGIRVNVKAPKEENWHTEADKVNAAFSMIAVDWHQSVELERLAIQVGDCKGIAESYYGRYGPEGGREGPEGPGYTGGIGLASESGQEYQAQELQRRHAQQQEALETKAFLYGEADTEEVSTESHRATESLESALKRLRSPKTKPPSEGQGFIMKALTTEYKTNQETDSARRIVAIALWRLAKRERGEVVRVLLSWHKYARPSKDSRDYSQAQKAGNRATETTIKEINRYFARDPRAGHEGPGGRKAISNARAQRDDETDEYGNFKPLRGEQKEPVTMMYEVRN